MSVIVCDDDGGRVEDWADQIRRTVNDRADVEALSPERFASAVEALKHRRVTGAASADAARVFDDADVLVVDSDLTPDHAANVDEQVRLQLNSEMGGEIAHLARGLTTVGAIVVVNEGTQQRTFDLTLMSRTESVADVYVSEDDVANPWLWGVRGAPGSFCPSYWPRLDVLPSAIDETVDEIEDLDSPWVNLFDLDSVDWETFLLAGQVESLGLGSSADLRKMTLRDMAAHTTLGMRRKEEATPEALPRVAICALRRWVERRLLPSQNVIVDLPHLMQRHPRVVDQREDLERWNSLSDERWQSHAPILQEAWSHPLSRLVGQGVWIVSRIESNSSASQMLRSDPVFCEDISSFADIDSVHDFVSDVEGAYARRFVADIDDVEYMPRNRLAV